MTDTAVVVVAWNGGEKLARCLRSVRRQFEGDVCVVDNASEPGERERLVAHAREDGRCELLFSAENAGFAEGANRGLRHAFEKNARAAFLLTQDVVLEEGALEKLRETWESHPDAGVVGPVVVDESAGGRELSRGEWFSLPLLCIPRTLLRYRGARSFPYEVRGVLGCAFLLSREAFFRVGGLDGRFFAYYEEVDLCIRLRRAGLRIYVDPRARVRHDGWRGFYRGLGPESAVLKARNLLGLAWKLGNGPELAFFLPTYAALVLSSAGVYLLRGRRDVARALLHGMSTAWRERKRWRS